VEKRRKSGGRTEKPPTLVDGRGRRPEDGLRYEMMITTARDVRSIAASVAVPARDVNLIGFQRPRRPNLAHPPLPWRTVPDVQYLSQAAHDRLTAELEELTTVGRIDIARKIQAARELGDLKENGDYHAAKDHQGQMEARIRTIEAILAHSEIVEGGATDTVQAGCVVSLRYEGDGPDDIERFVIGSIEEKRADVESMSPTSPLGSALIGAKKGEWVEFEAPNGILKVEVVDISE